MNFDLLALVSFVMSAWAYAYLLHVLPSLPREFVWWGIPASISMGIGFFLFWFLTGFLVGFIAYKITGVFPT